MCDCSVGCVCSLSVFDWPWPAHSNIRGKVNLELLIVFREFDQLIGPLPQYQLASNSEPSWSAFLQLVSTYINLTNDVTFSASLQFTLPYQLTYSCCHFISFLTEYVTFSGSLTYSLRFLISFLTDDVTLHLVSPYTFLTIDVTFSASLQLTLPYQLPYRYCHFISFLTTYITFSASLQLTFLISILIDDVTFSAFLQLVSPYT